MPVLIKYFMLNDNSIKSPTVKTFHNSGESNQENSTLSVIIRCHKEERLPFLDEALFSLALQEWTDLEVIIVLQNGTKAFKNTINGLIKKQPFHQNCRFQIQIVKIPMGVDGRSSLLNHGIKASTGRYLAFLDDDDLVYHHGYRMLIEQLTKSGKAVAVGGCRRADVKEESDAWHVQTKTTPYAWGSNHFDLFKDNFIPIHSYVIDQTRVDRADLYFDDDFPLLEDYEFLLRVGAKYDFDYSKLNVFVCEYRIHDSNSLPYTGDAKPEAVEKHLRVRQMIAERKSGISYQISLTNLLDLLAAGEKKPTQEAIISNFSEGSVELKNPFEIENPQLIRRAFRSVEDRVYDFFSRFPRLEKNLSKIVYFSWKTVISPRPSDAGGEIPSDDGRP